ncbi:MAG: hypothetical protein WAP35_05095 [Solirubrobacterales bacterium]
MDTLEIASWTRLYRLLADRPEFRRADLGERIDATSDEEVPLGALDRVLIERSSELDRLCGYAVGKIARGGKAVEILDVLGTLDPARIVAMYYALPKDRRRIVEKDPAWCFHVANAPDGVEEVEFRLDEFDLKDDGPIPPELENFRRERRRYKAGLPHDLSPAEMELVDGTV